MMNTVTVPVAKLKSALEVAIWQGDLTVQFQPRINPLTGATEAVEALARWCHPEFGMVSPVDFIPLAEQEGWILELGRQVMAKACQQARIWHQEGFELIVSVNVSAVQLKNPDFLLEVKRSSC